MVFRFHSLLLLLLIISLNLFHSLIVQNAKQGKENTCVQYSLIYNIDVSARTAAAQAVRIWENLVVHHFRWRGT